MLIIKQAKEIEIPFSNLPFNQGDLITWGMNITRFIQRKYETINSNCKSTHLYVQKFWFDL